MKLTRNEEAVADFSRAIQLAPKDEYLYLARAAALVQLGRDREALADRNQAVTIRPDFVEGYLARGGSYHKLGMHVEGF